MNGNSMNVICVEYVENIAAFETGRLFHILLHFMKAKVIVKKEGIIGSPFICQAKPVLESCSRPRACQVNT